jgi:hypothetical protein
MKSIKTKRYIQAQELYNPYRVDFTKEEALAKQKSTDVLLYALSDAIEASKVSPNEGKYLDQASVYRQVLERDRGMSINEQDRMLGQIKSLHTNQEI